METRALPLRAELLIAINAMGDEVRGRTLLQKRMYLLAVLLKQDLGFRSHFYGPYSSELHGEVVQATSLHYLAERSVPIPSAPGESQRIDYCLSDLGRAEVARYRAAFPIEAMRIENAAAKMMAACGELDGAALSIAAKVHYILVHKNGLSLDEIQAEAHKLRWDVAQDKVFAGAQSLQHLGLLEMVQPEEAV